uniref:B9 domain-containing protein 2 n=1 Tax=Plectus sambesii TaxID=2011161 RepID=A0A914UJ60_9BILA
MAEVHIIGQIEAGYQFPDSRLFCRWEIQIGGGWRLLGGVREGQTQTDLPEMNDVAHFCHPIDVHLATKTIQGWPKIYIQVWHYDVYGRQELYGYGFCHVPTSPGEHVVECPTWRPAGGFREEMMQKFVGGGLQLRSMEAIYNSTDRMKLKTIAMGTVALRLGVILRNFDKFGIEC